MARKPKGSHRAYREWAPSVKLLGQNIIEIKSIIISTQLNNKWWLTFWATNCIELKQI